MRDENITRGNTKKIFKTRARLDVRKMSFTNRVVNDWNDMPEWVVNADSVEKFERRLDKHWADQERKYNHRALIKPTRSPRVYQANRPETQAQ